MMTCLRRLTNKPVCCYALMFAAVLLSIQLPAQNSKLIIQPGTKLIVANNILVLNNTDIEADGNLDASTGHVLLTGTSNTAINGTTAPVINVLTLSKGGSSIVTLNNDVTIDSLLQFSSGFIDLNKQTITLSEGSMLQDESETARITGITGGDVVTRASAINNPSAQNIGNLGAAITSTQNLAGVTVSRMHQPVVLNDTATSIQRTYLFQPDNNIALNATLRFYYLDAELDGHDESRLSLWASTDGINWSSTGAAASNTAGNYVEQNGLPSLGYFTLSDAGNILPVTLVYFGATCSGQSAQITWKTATETNTKEFVIQRSSNASAWADIQTAAANNSSAGSSYTSADNNPQATAYYRLKIIDKNGAVSYSPTFSGGCSDVAMPFRVYPNPAKDQAVASISVRETTKAILAVYDMTGKQVYNAAWTLQPGMNQAILPVSRLAAGTYTVKVISKTIASQTKLIKQ